jgi:fatty acid desaturase
LWAPLGQRYHALHHVFPSIPYHWLGVAHRRLMRQLPADNPYRKTVRKGLIKALIEMWTRARNPELQSN